MNYEKKYLKYKEKYLLLKKQIGGDGDIFYIYTTGIAEWGHLDLWTSTLCKQICTKIPARFTQIYIFHCDILHEIKMMSLYDSEEKKAKIVANIKDTIQLDLNIDSRVRHSSFQTTPLDFDEISRQKIPYIIIDMAQIFSYLVDETSSDKITRAFINGTYGEVPSKPMNLNVIYLSYGGEYLSDTEFLKVNSDDTITTYINKLLEPCRFLPFDDNKPGYKMKKLFELVQRQIMNENRKKYGNLNKYDEKRIIVDGEIKKMIVNLIMNSDYVESELITKACEHIMTEFFS